MSILAILFYEPVAVFSRPLWQQAKTGLNIKIKPVFLLFKTCIQILLIAVGKSLQGISPLSHGIVFSIIFISFTVITYKIRPFNYKRCNLWEIISLMAVSYLSVLATLSYIGNQTHVAWFICLMVGWSIMGLTGLYIQKKHMPNLLISPSDKDNKIVNYNAVKPMNFDQSQDISDIKDYKEVEIKVDKDIEDKEIRENRDQKDQRDGHAGRDSIVCESAVKLNEVSNVEEIRHRNSDNEDEDEEAQPIK
jgi:hypothetical protein